MPFAIPLACDDSTNHLNDCYFCTVTTIKQDIMKKTKKVITHTYISSEIQPVPHGDDLSVPVVLYGDIFPHILLSLRVLK